MGRPTPEEPNPIVSVRLPESTIAWLKDTYGGDRANNVRAAIAEVRKLREIAQAATPPEPPPAKTVAEIKAARPAKPAAPAKAKKVVHVTEKPAARVAHSVAKNGKPPSDARAPADKAFASITKPKAPASLQVGPTATPLGSRLKAEKKAKR